MPNYGTLQVLDALAASQTIAQYGEDRAFAGIQANLDAYNALVQDELGDLCELSTDRLRRYGGSAEMDMDEADEYGTADAQKITAGVNVGFPLRHYQISVQWTRAFMQVATVAELDAQFVAARTADAKNIQRQIRRAIFTPTNNTSYTDRMVDNVTLPLRAFLNADGTAIPNDPFGNTFSGGSHTHYLANATLTEAAATSLVETVVEHGLGGEVRLYINRAQESTVRGFAGFTPYYDMRITPATSSASADGSLDQSNLYDRAIGVFGAAEVWVKPWMLANYLFAFDRQSPLKPLVFRTRNGGAFADFTIAADHEHFPLRAQTMARDFGVGVWNRANGAVLYIGGGSYVTPTI
jgi:hypothetical protein